MTEPKKKATAKGGSLHIRALSQTDFATLIGKPTAFVRDHGAWFARDEQGRYDGPQGVAAMQAHVANDCEPSALSDVELEGLLQVTESAAYSAEFHRPAAIRLMQSIQRRGGTAGLAAIGRVLLEQYIEVANRYPELPRKSPEEIRADYEARAAKEIAELDVPDYYGELREIEVCRVCKRYKFAGKWRKGAIPAGYVISDPGSAHWLNVCPDCEAKQ